MSRSLRQLLSSAGAKEEAASRCERVVPLSSDIIGWVKGCQPEPHISNWVQKLSRPQMGSQQRKVPENEVDGGGAGSGSGEISKVCDLFRKPTKGKNIRKRTFVEGEGEDEDCKESAVVFKKKKQAVGTNKLHFSSGQPKLSKESEVEKSKASVTDFLRDARAIRERVLKQAGEALKGKKNSDGGKKLYKGLHGYTDYKAGFRREQTVASEKAGGSHGPLRASAHIRASAKFDYQPDICKDYKETGYCGYGDSCKFMHDRGDYKFGWQMEKEWDEKEKARAKRNEDLSNPIMDCGAGSASPSSVS